MGECCPAVRPEMRSLLLLLGLVTLALAQRGGRPKCPDGERPSCADGSRPERPPRGQRGPPTCSDGNSPVCSDGSAPQKPERKGPCSDGSTPTCGGASPVCPDGSALSTESRSAQTPASHHCATMAVSRAGLDVADQADRAEAELDSSWIKTSTLSLNEIGLKINSNLL